MENKLDDLMKTLAECCDELHAPAITEADIQRIITEAKADIAQCSLELEQAQKTIVLTEQQLSAVKSAREASEAQAATAAAEENDARIAVETARKMLEDATRINVAANKDTANILQRAAAVLEDTIKSANDLYEQKVEQRKAADQATVRIFATEKAIDYAAARAYTTEGIRLKEKITAEKIAEIKEAESSVLVWQRKLDQLAHQRDTACFEDDIERFQNALAVAEQRIADNEQAEIQEKAAAEAQQDAEKAACSQRIDELTAQRKIKEDEKSAKAEELALANAEEASCLDVSKMAAEEVAAIAAETEQVIKDGQNEKEASYAKWDAGIENIRQEVSRKKLAYLAVEEKAITANSRLEDMKQQADSLRQQIACAIEEEESARDAAEVARRLADNTSKIRSTIGQQSADLLFQAQQVLSESAEAADVLMKQKHEARLAVEKQGREIDEKVSAGQLDVSQAQRQAAEAKSAWENQEDLLKREIVTVDQAKSELSNAFDLKVQNYQEKLAAAQSVAAEKKEAIVRAKEKVRSLESAILALEQSIKNCDNEIAAVRSKTEEACVAYKAASQGRLSAIFEAKQSAVDDAAYQRNKLADVHAAMANMSREEEKLQEELAAAEDKVKVLIDSAAQQIMAAEADVEQRRQAEEEAHKASDEVASYVETLDIATGYEYASPEITIPVTEAESAEEAAEEAAKAELAEEAAEEAAEAESAEEAVEEAVEAEAVEEMEEAVEAEPVEEAAEEAVEAESAEEAVEEAAEVEAVEEAAEEAVEAEPAEEAAEEAAKAEPAEEAVEEAVEAELAEEAAEEAAEAEPGDGIDEQSSEAELEKARIRAAEEAEEAEIMKGLTGSIPMFTNHDEHSDGSEEYTAWLDIIDSDMVQKILNGDDQSEDEGSPIKDLIADLERNLDKQESQPLTAPSVQDSPKEEKKEEEIPVKKKRHFRFF